MSRSANARLTRGLVVATFASTLLMVSGTAHAQCPSRPWPTTQFEVAINTHPLNPISWLDSMSARRPRTISTKTWRGRIGMGANHRRRPPRYSAALRGRGIRMPVLEAVSRGRRHEVSGLSDHRPDDVRWGFDSFTGLTLSPTVSPGPGDIIINREDINYLPTNVDEAELYIILVQNGSIRCNTPTTLRIIPFASLRFSCTRRAETRPLKVAQRAPPRTLPRSGSQGSGNRRKSTA